MTTAGQPQRLLRNYLLDRRLQLKVTLFVVSVTLVVAMALGAFLWWTTRALFEEAEAAVDARSKAAEASRELGNAVLARQLLDRFNDPVLAAKLDAESKTLDLQYERERTATVAQREAMIRHHRTLLVTLFGALAAFVLVVAAACIVATHRIVGPLFRLKRIAQEVGEGKLQPHHGLRSTDELHDVFEVFNKMVDALRQSEASHLEQITVAIDRAERTGVPLDVLKEMRKLESRLKERAR